MKNNLNTKFDEDNFADIVVTYNNLKGNTSKDLREEEESTRFILANIGFGLSNNDRQYYGQVMYRKYIPKISLSTSVNIGVSYYRYRFTEQNRDFNQSLLSIPFQIQQNILNKKIRPYFFAGLSLTYLKLTDRNDNSLINQGFQESYGMNLLYGAGIEIDVSAGVYLKSEYRNEAYSHPIVFGIGYIF